MKEDKNVTTHQILELKNAGINFFNEVSAIIQSYNIDLWIEYGSLLGYVRHKDLIPWDSEFDLGVFKNKWNLNIEESLMNKGFLIIHEPYRVKIQQPNTSIGMFTIDIHLHEIVGQRTRLLFGEVNPHSSTIWSKLLWFFDITSVSYNSLPIRYLSIMKSLSSKFNIMTDSILNKKISIHKGRYNHEESFVISLDDIVVDDFFSNKIKKYRVVLLDIISCLPNFVHSKIKIFLRSKARPIVYLEKFQTMPLYIYQEFEDITFCGVKIKAPKKREEFLTIVYGSDWKIPKMNFSRLQMKNLIKF